VARGTQHRKRRTGANARTAAVAARPRRDKPPQWQEQLFFQRLRLHAKWAYVVLAVAFAATFALLGVGSGVISQLPRVGDRVRPLLETAITLVVIAAVTFALAFVVFAAIAVADYLDGFVARLTGQYSRLGALLDPVTDRILVVSGMVVAWHFSLLPRWAIAVVIARELVMVALSRYGLSRGVELKINWPGRIGVAPAMAAPGAALLDLHQVALVMLYVGMALGLLASVLYVRDGIRQIQTRNELPKVSS
jgi:CDP-diacylglycerol--glycerol-3-phosphate 3-phosphatidyltransferase